MWFIACCVLILLVYVSLISIFLLGWLRTPMFSPTGNETFQKTSVSVVVACRNEENNLPRLLSGLLAQSCRDFQLILVDDHSEDNTLSVMGEYSDRFTNLKIIHASGYGKKNALKEGINSATGELIITTDADCIPMPEWIRTIILFYWRNPADLIICPVKLIHQNTFFSRLQSLEFISMVASGAGASGAGMPIMCNGANLAFRKEVWGQSQHDLHEEELSGDDIFLLLSVKKRNGIVRFLKSKNAFVQTDGAPDWVKFIKQRTRWAGKSPAYTDLMLIVTACAVFGICLLIVIALISSLVGCLHPMVLLILFGCKYLIDCLFLVFVKSFFEIHSVLLTAFALSLFYPFYIVFVGISALIFKPDTWS